jgi:hypothetical protein
MLPLFAVMASVLSFEADSARGFIPDSSPAITTGDSAALLVHFARNRQTDSSGIFTRAARYSFRTDEADTVRRRGRALAVSDGYATRLKIHQIGAIAMLPLVASEFIIGQSLITSDDRSSGLKTAHRLVAGGIGVVFGVNTITGALNWWETRKDPAGRTRRTLHSLLMLASDAGFLWAAAAAGGASHDLPAARHHRAIAEAAISVSVLSTVMMWLWKG